ncbi:MAG: hypothetical protein GXO48_00855 [Chlorobi bacterium]|nr:hypothetical protein [Chlorobiota bacterium]
MTGKNRAIKRMQTLAIALVMSGCKVFYPEVMFIENVDPFLVDSLVPQEYVLSSGDKLKILVQPRKGQQLVDVATNMQTTRLLSYEIMPNGYVYLPIIDSVRLAGYTVAQARKLLTELYSQLYKDPYVYLEVTNRFVYVFYQDKAQAVEMPRNNMTLFEALAKAGGIPQMHKAYKIKIIRMVGGKPMVKQVNLRDVSQLPNAQVVLQANDIVYVEPTRRVAPAVLREITPLLTLVSSFTSLILTILLLQQNLGG